jgi:hypothetical protein
MKEVGFNKLELNRLDEAILSVLYEVYPLELTETEIMMKIIEKDLLHMSEEEFIKYRRQLVQSREN